MFGATLLMLTVCDCHPTPLLLFPCEKQIKLLCPWWVDVSASHCTVE